MYGKEFGDRKIELLNDCGIDIPNDPDQIQQAKQITCGSVISYRDHLERKPDVTCQPVGYVLHRQNYCVITWTDCSGLDALYSEITVEEL